MLAIDPGYHCGVCLCYEHLWDVVQIGPPQTGTTARRRTNLAQTILSVLKDQGRWPRVVMEIGKGRKGRSAQSSVGLGLTAGAWHAAESDPKGWRYLDPGKWQKRHWKLEIRSLLTPATWAEIESDAYKDAQAALGIALYARAHQADMWGKLPKVQYPESIVLRLGPELLSWC